MQKLVEGYIGRSFKLFGDSTGAIWLVKRAEGEAKGLGVVVECNGTEKAVHVEDLMISHD